MRVCRVLALLIVVSTSGKYIVRVSNRLVWMENTNNSNAGREIVAGSVGGMFF